MRMPYIQIDLWLIILVILAAIAAIALVIIYGIRAHKQQISAGREELIGKMAEVITAMEPKGTVHISGEQWTAILDEGRAGDNIGVLLRGIEKDGIERGQVLAKPGSITPHTVFKAEVYVLSKEEGGRHTPFFSGYRPQFYLRTTDVTGAVTLPEGTEMVMPGDNVKMKVKLITPVALEEGLRFAIREGGHTVWAGVMSKVS